MINPKKSKQRVRQAGLANTSNQWQSLTDAQRLLWQEYAEDFPIPSRLNPDSNLNGFNYFQQYHVYRKIVGLSAVLPGPYGTRENLVSYQIDMTSDGGDTFLALDAEGLTSSFRVAIYSTRPIQDSQQFIHQSPRVIFSAQYITPFEPSLWNQYIANFGFNPVAGQSVGIKIVLLNQNAGQFYIIPLQKVLVVAD